MLLACWQKDESNKMSTEKKRQKKSVYELDPEKEGVACLRACSGQVEVSKLGFGLGRGYPLQLR